MPTSTTAMKRVLNLSYFLLVSFRSYYGRPTSGSFFFFFFFNDTATTEIYTTANPLSLHDALPIWRPPHLHCSRSAPRPPAPPCRSTRPRSEEHTSELQSLAVISYAVFCLKKKKTKKKENNINKKKKKKKKKK